jgi:putative transposase
MGIGRSTFYGTPDARARDLTIVAEMKTICDEFEAYGYRRVDAELRHRGIVVNAKKIRRLMREHALNPKQRRRFVATTDSDHNYPIFPNLAKNMKLDGPNQLWVADITYVTIATGFVYLAAILDAWSRRVVGYTISRSIDARLAVAALKAAISALTTDADWVSTFLFAAAALVLVGGGFVIIVGAWRRWSDDRRIRKHLRSRLAGRIRVRA